MKNELILASHELQMYVVEFPFGKIMNTDSGDDNDNYNLERRKITSKIQSGTEYSVSRMN
jgi:hypothetical protein